MEFWTSGGGLAKNRALPASFSEMYSLYVEGAKAAEEMGFDAYGSAEHHFMYDGFLPMPLNALAAVAAATQRIKLITGTLLLPVYDPLRIAEDAATLDVLCGGRLMLGLGMGYRPMEFDGFGLSKRTRGKRLVEMMKIIREATSKDVFSYDGEFHTYRNVRLHPTPLQRPIPIWLCGRTSLNAARRAGAAGFPYWLANVPLERAEAMMAEYRRLGREQGYPEEQLKVAVFKDVCIASTVKEAQEMRDFRLKNFYEEHILGYGYLVDDEGNHLYNPPLDHPLYQRFVDSVFCGTVEMVIEEQNGTKPWGYTPSTSPACSGTSSSTRSCRNSGEGDPDQPLR